MEEIDGFGHSLCSAEAANHSEMGSIGPRTGPKTTKGTLQRQRTAGIKGRLVSRLGTEAKRVIATSGRNVFKDSRILAAKTVSKNLLHKTEIVQTNVFNGMTLPEMVSKVADGVLEELNNRGFGSS